MKYNLSLFVVHVLFGILSNSQAQEIMDPFDQIPIKYEQQIPNISFFDENQIQNSNKTIKLQLNRTGSYKEMVRDLIFQKHMKVQSDKLTDLGQNSTKQSDSQKPNITVDHKKKIQIQDINSMSYFAKFYIGSNQQEIRVGFSTIQDISIINSKGCQGCYDKAKGFYYQASNSIYKVIDKKLDLQIDGETATGVIVQDDLMLSKDKDSKLKDFPFLLVNKWSQNVFEKVDGLIGLSKKFVSVNGQNSESQFLNSLYLSGQIDNRIFSVHFDVQGGSSIEFGGYDIKNINKGQKMIFIKVPYGQEWQVSISAFKVTDQPLFDNGAKNSFQIDSVPAYLDTFSPFIKLPKTGSAQIFAKMLHGIDYRVVDGILMGTCDLSFYHTISLYINDKHYFKLQPESYVIDIGQGDKCFIAIEYGEEEHFILGEPFFRSFYSIFDDTKGVVGLAPSANYPQSQIFEGDLPLDQLDIPGKIQPDQAQEIKNLPNFNEPSSVFSYVMKYISDYFSNFFSGISSSSKKGGSNDETSGRLVIFLIVLLTLCGCCCGVFSYVAYLGYKYYTGDLSLSKAGLNSSQIQTQKRPQVQNSRIKKTINDEDQGVSLQNLLTQSEIQKKLDEIKILKNDQEYTGYFSDEFSDVQYGQNKTEKLYQKNQLDM